MRKVIVLEHISIDGVIQAPGGPEEDTSDGFAYGGWSARFDDDAIGAALKKMLPASEYEQMAAECQRGERELRIEDGFVMTTLLPKA